MKNARQTSVLLTGILAALAMVTVSCGGGEDPSLADDAPFASASASEKRCNDAGNTNTTMFENVTITLNKPTDAWFGSWNYGTTEDELVLSALRPAEWRFELRRKGEEDDDPVIRTVVLTEGVERVVDR